MSRPKFGSGTGGSFDSDYLKCKRLFYWRHRQGVVRREKGDGAALIVGSAGHAWMEAFYERLAVNPTDYPIAAGDAAFSASILRDSDEARGLGYDTIDVEAKSDTALTLLHALAPSFAKRVSEGERTVGCEMEGTLTLPELLPTEWPDTNPRYINSNLRSFTVAIDRAFYHPGDDEQPNPGLAIDEYKFTSMSSVKQYAENMLLNDQSLGYLYWLSQAARSPIAELKTDWGGSEVVGVRYRIFRVEGRVTDKSYCEVWEPVNRARLDDWYARKCALRAEMSRQWDRPMVEWTANRFAFGPCHSFGRECAYWAMCDEPGDEQSKIGEPEDVGTLYVREPSDA